MADAKTFLAEKCWLLPEWATWSKQDWIDHQDICRNVFNHNLGWDITDFGSGNFQERGLFLFTLRNGAPGKQGKPYAEKIMIVREGQETPYHFHWHKMEDIINRGGGILLFNIYKSSKDESFSDEKVSIYIDDCKYTINPGEQIGLKPGQSLTLEQNVYHRFYGAEGTGPVLVGEVSQVNDDSSDNRFYEEIGRFPAIEEDEEPLHYLSCDYEMLMKEMT